MSGLTTLCEKLCGSHAFAGISIGRDVAVGTAAGIDADAASMFRVASISKIVVGQLLVELPLDTPVADLVGSAIMPPSGQRPSLGQVLSHSAGLSDTALPVEPEGRFDAWLESSDIWLGHAPGTYFSYSNLGYIIAARCAEVLHGADFGSLSRDWLRSHDIPGGFNWFDTAPKDALPTYRRDGAAYVAQIDDPPVWPKGNIAAMSPQGGLRTSMVGLTRLSTALGNMDHTPLWRRSDGPGEYLGGLMHSYGHGLQILPDPPFYPRPLVGHFANAYGFCGGVWYDTVAKTGFSYALNGLPLGDEDDALRDAEKRIFDAVAVSV